MSLNHGITSITVIDSDDKATSATNSVYNKKGKTIKRKRKKLSYLKNMF